MDKRELGGSGIHIAPWVLGGNVFGWTADEPTSHRLLDAFVDAGFDCIDTADSYSAWVPGNQGGESESIIGRWLKASGKRDKVTLATKVGMWAKHKGLKAGNINAAIEQSLQRLQTDRIDLYQAHEDDPDTPIEETMRAFDHLIRAGKVRTIGASNYERDRLRQALQTSEVQGVARYQTLQPRYNLYDRVDFEAGLQPLCVRENLGVIPYYGLASGFLSGKYRSNADLDKSPRGGGVARYLDERGMRILEALDDVSARRSAKPAQVAIAWLLTRPAIVAPIASVTSLEQLQELAGAVRLRLDREDLETLQRASG